MRTSLKKCIERHPGLLKTHKVNDGLIITDSTKRIQKFLRRFGDSASFFDDVEEFVRDK
mgnify:CR=1 FL=1